MHANIFTPPVTPNNRELLTAWLDHIEALPAAHIATVKMNVELFTRIKWFIQMYRGGQSRYVFEQCVYRAIDCYNEIIQKINTQS